MKNKIKRIVNLILLLFVFSVLSLPANAQLPAKVFAPYVDVCSWPTFSIENMYLTTGQKYYTLAFILSDVNGKPSWGGVIPLNDGFYKDEIEYIRSMGGDVIISCGGANGTELAMAHKDVTALQAAYQSVIDMYKITWMDFDIEGGALADGPSIDRRNKAIRRLQIANPGLKVAFCLPVLPQGLTQDGLNVIRNARDNEVRIDAVNVMAMDYGDWAAPNPEGNMGQYAIDAAVNTHDQILGLNVNTKIGITPMIGQNDVPSERFYVSCADKLYQWAIDKDWVCLLSMWSCNRDNGTCPGGSAQSSCSGIAQNNFDFTKAFINYSSSGASDNKYPTVRISSPADKSSFKQGADVIINVDASDPDGTIAKVDFYSNSVFLGSVTQFPFSKKLSGLSTGSYVFKAVATDNKGASAISSPVQIFVGNACTAPTWKADTVYHAGDVVSFDNHEWFAKWWTVNEKPGTTGQWGVWKDLGNCSGSVTPPPAPTPDDCPYPVWSADQNWTTYKVGDRKVNGGKLWECRNTAYSYLEPSGTYGIFGWVYIRDCK